MVSQVDFAVSQVDFAVCQRYYWYGFVFWGLRCRFVDSNLAASIDGKKSTIRYVFTLGCAAIGWVSRLQKIVTISTTEAEYVAATKVCMKMIWLLVEKLHEGVG